MTTATMTRAEQRFREDPESAKARPAVTATLVNGHARLSAGAFNWDADLPAALGGTNLAPSPTAYLLGALAGCAVAFLHDTLAPQFGVHVEDVTAVASCSTDLRGLFGMESTLPDLTDIALTIEVRSPDAPEHTDPMLAAWRERCPIFLALLRPNAVAFEATVIAA
jgi:uncharacterized OsmC-like protein